MGERRGLALSWGESCSVNVWIYFLCVLYCCVVKDRYGDRAGESDSESSESSSDDSEVVSMAASPLSRLSA